MKRSLHSRHGRGIAKWSARVALVVVVLGLWQVLSGRLLDPFVVSSPTAVAESFGQNVANGDLVAHTVHTLGSALAGFLIGGTLAVIVGYAVGVSSFWSSVVEPYVGALFAVPRVAFIPVLIIWLGTGRPLAITASAILAFFLLFYNTYYGVREVSTALLNSVRIMGGKPHDLALRVRLPSAFVWIVAGMKTSIPQALVGAVTAEILASNRGIGYFIQFNAGQFNTAAAFASLVALVVIGFALNESLNLLSRRALIWKGEGAS